MFAPGGEINNGIQVHFKLLKFCLSYNFWSIQLMIAFKAVHGGILCFSFQIVTLIQFYLFRVDMGKGAMHCQNCTTT